MCDDGLTPELLGRLERLSANPVILDQRRAVDRAEAVPYLRLYDLGLCALVETGPGDSILKLTINEAGRQALRRG